MLLSYSGGAQVATGAVNQGFCSGANDLSHAQHLYRLTAASDWIERTGTWIFPQRWRLIRWSGWNRAARAGKITVHWLDPATHFGPRSYISPQSRLPDGRSYLDRTTDTVIALIRDSISATTEP